MLYEFDFQLHISDMFQLLTFILPICLYMFSGCFKNRIARYTTITLSLLSAFLILTFLFILPIYSFLEIKQEIKENKLLSVSGEVTEFESPESSFGGHNSESFKIDGVEFAYYGNENYGYSDFLCDGGVIKGNGQELNILYCYDPITEEKVICYIKALE